MSTHGCCQTPAEHVAGEEVATTLLGYPDRLAQVELSWASLGYPRMRSIQTSWPSKEPSSLFVDHDGQVRVSHRDGRQEQITIDTTDAYRRSWQRSRTSPSASYQRTVRDLWADN